MSIVDNKNVEDRYVIQILRAIAICLVVFHHSVNALNLPEYMNVSVQIINKIHVNIFFVISGFLFEKKKILYIQNSAKKFVQKKFIQLIPTCRGLSDPALHRQSTQQNRGAHSK